MSYYGKAPKRKLTRDERLWNLLSKDIKNGKLARKIFSYVTKNFSDSRKTISIKYEVDDKAILQATKAVRQLQAGLKRFARL